MNIHKNNLIFSSAAVSYTVAEQFNQSIEMEAITRSSKIGRSEGECFFYETQNLNFLSFPTQSVPKSPATNSGSNFSKKNF